MGLRLDGSTVVVDHAVKDHLYTGTYSNPSKYTVGDVDVISVYRRKKSSGVERRDRLAKRTGDNCPLIYALKRVDGLDVKVGSIKKLLEYMPAILDEVVEKLPKDFTHIVTIPSSHQLARILAKRIALRMNIPILDGLLEKSTCFEATMRADTLLKKSPKSVPREIEVALRNTVKNVRKTAKLPYSSKFTPVHIRNHFDPLKISPRATGFTEEAKVLLIDDLLASGETLVAANHLLKCLGLKANCQAVTWFGSV